MAVRTDDDYTVGPVLKRAKLRPSRSMEKPWRWGLFIIVLFFGIGGGIAAIAPLSTAVTGNGAVTTEGTVQTVQPLEPGIISEVLISEGDEVVEGQELLLLETTQTEGEIGSALQRLRQAAAREHRLLAEQAGQGAVEFSHWSLSDSADPEVSGFVKTERDLFDSRGASHTARKSILSERVRQLESQVTGYQVRLIGLTEQSSLLAPEVANLEEAFEEGLVPRAQVLQAQRQASEVRSQIGQVEAEIARVRDVISETKIEKVELDSSRLAELSRELTVAQTERRVSEESYARLEDRLSKRTITAPVSGVVMNLKQSNPGSVVGPGEVVLEIVPSQERLIVDVQVRPVDIDMVYVGQSADVLFSALPSDISFPVNGEVTRVSANVIVPQGNVEPFYQVQIVVDEEHLRERFETFRPVVGMPVQAFMEAGDRTLLQYIISPATDLWRNAMREE